MNVYEIDTTIQVESSPPFSQVGGAAFDPTTVTLYFKDPNGEETTVPMSSLTHVTTGVWSYQFTPGVSGVWTYKFQGAGNCAVTSPDTRILVQSSRLISG